MIASLDGEVIERSPGCVVISVGGVGYEVAVAASTSAELPGVGKHARLFTRMHVRDDAMLLFGFVSREERSLFDLLVTVSGVGPKVALSFLSVLSPDALRRAVATGDLAALTLVPGVGRKLAQRVLVELRDRVGGDGLPPEGPLSEVREALLALGLTPQEASDAMAPLRANGSAPTEDLLREALQHVGRG